MTSKPTGTGNDFANNMKKAFEEISDSYGYEKNPIYPISNHKTFEKSKKDIVWKYEYSFFQTQSGVFTFDMGTDFGWGYVVYLDDE